MILSARDEMQGRACPALRLAHRSIRRRYNDSAGGQRRSGKPVIFMKFCAVCSRALSATGRAAMTATIPDEFIAAFNRVWRLPAGMDNNTILKSSEFLLLRNTADKLCYAKIKGNLLDPFLLRGLQKLGVPCLFPTGSPLAATDRSETAARC